MNYHCTMNRPSSFYFCESGVFLSGSSYLLTAVGTSKAIGPLCISVCLWVLIEFFHDKWPLTYSSSLKVNVRVHDPWEKDVFGLWMHVLSMHVTTWKVFDFFVELIVLKCQCDLDWGYCSCFVDRVNSDIVVYSRFSGHCRRGQRLWFTVYAISYQPTYSGSLCWTVPSLT